MSSSDFRHIAIKAEAGRADRLFRAAVSAFCALTRPSRREIAQLEDLTLPLLQSVSVEARRFVAAALSECAHSPATLVRRLADEPVAISAPLLIRSQALNDVDLIALIGRHGLPHARVIAKRDNLNATIADLVRAIDRPTLVASSPAPVDRADNAPERHTGEATENVRRRLRAMMVPSGEPTERVENAPQAREQVFRRLLTAALSDQPALFNTAIADALDISFARAASLSDGSSYFDLLHAMRAVDLSDEQAFLLAASHLPRQFGSAASVRLFLYRYELVTPTAARNRVAEWKQPAPSPTPLVAAANSAEQKALRVS